jgi:hypothetical protein
LQFFVACGRSDVTPTMATRIATVDMTVKWRLNPRNRIEFAHGRIDLEYTKRFLGINRHFTAISTVTTLVAIVGVTLLHLHATKCFEVPLVGCPTYSPLPSTPRGRLLHSQPQDAQCRGDKRRKINEK